MPRNDGPVDASIERLSLETAVQNSAMEAA
jgi:hypothetical protein